MERTVEGARDLVSNAGSFGVWPWASHVPSLDFGFWNSQMSLPISKPHSTLAHPLTATITQMETSSVHLAWSPPRICVREIVENVPSPPQHTHTQKKSSSQTLEQWNLNCLFPQSKDPPSNLPGKHSRVAWTISFWEAESHAPPDLLSPSFRY